MAPGLSQLEVVPFSTKLGAMDFFDPDRCDDYQFISGTKMRRLAHSGEQPPDGFMAPTAWKIIHNGISNTFKICNLINLGQLHVI